jgi:phosphosulfolactate synthase
MKNIKLPFLPDRTDKPRQNGLTMVMDKGLSLQEAKNFVEVASNYVDLVKLGFGTSFITPNINEKIKVYKSANIKVYLGGTFFEAFLIRDKLNDYIELIKRLELDTVEVSDGSISIQHKLKCEIIHLLSKKFNVLSEVGSKEEGIIIHPNKWINMMKKELEAGSWKVIAEAREGGNVGIYHRDGKTHSLLVDKILANVNQEYVIWEAPLKSQQVWFIKMLGANVNLGNIAPNDALPLETLRIGLRGDTFFSYLPPDKKNEIKNLDLKSISI